MVTVVSSSDPTARLAARLADPALAAALSHFVRARVPEPEVQDIVQSTLTAALSTDSEAAPVEDEEIVRWVYGICRHKVVDWFRRAKREVPHDLEAPDQPVVAAAESAPQSAMDLLRWARKELPAGEENAKTLEWMLREGAGEKLETIAAEANVPAPRVRQRVSRLRRYYKARWAAQAAALAALLLVAIALGLALRPKNEEVAPAPVPSLLPVPQPIAPDLPPPEAPAVSTPAPDLPPAPTDDPSAKAAPLPPPAPTGSTVAPLKKPSPKPSPTNLKSSNWDSSLEPVPPPPAPTDSINAWGATKAGAMSKKKPAPDPK